MRSSILIDYRRRKCTLSVIDMDKDVIVGEVPTAASPEEVLVSEDGHFVYVASEVDDFIHLVDADKGYVVENVVVGTRPRRFAATSDSKELWVSSELSGEVYIIGREKFTIAAKIEFLPPGVQKIDVTPIDLVITKDGKTAYVALDHAAHVAVVDVQTRKVQGYIPLGMRSSGLAIAGDENTLYVADSVGGVVHIVDVKGHKVTGSIPLDRTPSGVVIDTSRGPPGGERVSRHFLRTRRAGRTRRGASGVASRHPETHPSRSSIRSTAKSTPLSPMPGSQDGSPTWGQGAFPARPQISEAHHR